LLFLYPFPVHSSNLFKYQQVAMGTTIEVILVGGKEETAKKAALQAFQEIKRIDHLMSPWIESSDVTRLNRSAGNGWVRVSKETMEMAKRMGLELDAYGFCKTQPFTPTSTSKPGIYVCGAFQSPKDIPETVSQASGAVADATGKIAVSRGTMVIRKEYPPEADITTEEPRIGVFVCNCCGCCCGFLKMLREHDIKAMLAVSNFQVAIDEETCTGCGDCVDRCQMEALRLVAATATPSAAPTATPTPHFLHNRRIPG
jgi:NAD-dependent dihydropyrimidine dehydrogenase PreA subunit